MKSAWFEGEMKKTINNRRSSLLRKITIQPEDYIKIPTKLTNIFLFISAAIVIFFVWHFFFSIVHNEFTAFSIRHFEKIFSSPRVYPTPAPYPDIFNPGDTVYLSTYKTPFILFFMLHFWDASLFAAVFGILYFLREFLLSFEVNSIFTLENISALKKASLILISAPVIDYFIFRPFMNYLVRDITIEPGVTAAVSVNLIIYLGVLFMGTLFLAIIKAIEAGIILKEENDLTV